MLALAGQLETDLGCPVVPVFWIASDDHDLAEVARAWVTDAEGRLREVALPGHLAAAPLNRFPVSQVTLGAEVTAALDGLDGHPSPHARHGRGSVRPPGVVASVIDLPRGFRRVDAPASRRHRDRDDRPVRCPTEGDRRTAVRPRDPRAGHRRPGRGRADGASRSRRLPRPDRRAGGNADAVPPRPGTGRHRIDGPRPAAFGRSRARGPANSKGSWTGSPGDSARTRRCARCSRTRSSRPWRWCSALRSSPTARSSPWPTSGSACRCPCSSPGPRLPCSRPRVTPRSGCPRSRARARRSRSGRACRAR